MDFREGLSALLPPPRDDEPASLRHDIIDELSDHLACAYHRELLRGVDSTVARQRVLERFGDPASVACRLWIDAMKGKIMTQRVLIATCLVVTLASLTLAGLIWRQSGLVQQESARAAAAAIRAMELQNEKSQANQQEMLKHMRAMSEVVRSTHSLEWNPVTFKLTEETPDGPPVVGVSIALAERAVGNVGAGPGMAKPAWRVTDRSGVADFGVVRPGDYFYQIYKGFDQGSVSTVGELDIEPGSKLSKHITCPKTPLERTQMRFRWNWPDDLEKERLVLYTSFAHDPIKLQDVSWTLTDNHPPDPSLAKNLWLGPQFLLPATRSIVCGPAASMASVLPKKQPFLWALRDSAEQRVMADLLPDDVGKIMPPGETLHWERGNYRLSGIYVLRPIASGDTDRDRRRFELVIASPFRPGTPIYYSVLDSPPTNENRTGPRAKGARNRGQRTGAQSGFLTLGQTHSVPWEAWDTTFKGFEAQPGKIIDFTIPLPDELISAVRKRLKPEEAPKSQ